MRGRTPLIVGAVVAAGVVISCVGCLILGAIIGLLPTYKATSTAWAVSRATDTPTLPTNTPAPTATSALPTPTPIPTDTPAPTPTPEPQQFNGSGQQVSPQFTLNAGLAVFRMTHDGSRNFAVWLLNSRGERVELLVNEIGAFDGTKTVGIGSVGAYLLDIVADGNWTIAVEQCAMKDEGE